MLVHRPATEGRFGERTYDDDRAVPGCIVWPRGSQETTDRANTVVVGLSVFAPPGTDVQATDEVTVRGARWAVVGEPGDYRMGARQKGILIALEKATG